MKKLHILWNHSETFRGKDSRSTITEKNVSRAAKQGKTELEFFINKI